VNISNIFEHQVQLLADRVRRLESSHGADQASYEWIRKQVSSELINKSRPEVASAALGELGCEHAGERLKDMLTHCSEHFYFEDRVLSAIAVPVAFRMKAPANNQIEISEGERRNLTTLAAMARNVTGSRNMVFDSHLYDGKGLYCCSAKRLLGRLQHLEKGILSPEVGPTKRVINAQSEPAWQMLYLLGVQVTDVEGGRVVNDENSQRRLGNWTYHAEWALSQCNKVLSDRGITAQAQAHGFWYLSRGIQEGEDKIRGHRLKSLLANFDQGVRGVKFHYVHESVEFQVRLMIVSQPMTVEFQWKLMGDESLDGFCKELAHSILQVIPDGSALVVQQIEMYDYRNLAHQHGLSWMLGAMQ